MTVREIVFAVALAIAGGLLTKGMFELAESVGWIAAGVLLAVWTWLVLSGDDEPTTVESAAEGAAPSDVEDGE